jgi:hypothetical protein
MQQDTLFYIMKVILKVAESILKISLFKNAIITSYVLIVNSWMIGTSNFFSSHPHPQYVGSVP